MNTNIVDQVIQVKDDDAAETAQRLASKEGIPFGILSGAAARAAIQVAERLGEGTVVVTVLPDTGEQYLSTGLIDSHYG